VAVVGISILFILPVVRNDDPSIWDGFASLTFEAASSDISISWENAVETQEFSANPIVNNKIKTVVTGLPKSISNLFSEFLMDQDKNLVAEFFRFLFESGIYLSKHRASLVDRFSNCGIYGHDDRKRIMANSTYSGMQPQYGLSRII